MEDLAARGSPLEYWFFRTTVDDLAILVDVIVRRRESRAETRVAIRVGDTTRVERVFSDAWTADSQGVRAGENQLSAVVTGGQVADVGWSLDVDLGPDRILPLPPALAWLRPFDMQIVSRPTARLTGTVTLGGRAWTLSAEPGMVSHYWGSRLPKRWTWVSVTGSESEPRLESTVLRSRLWGTPLTLTVGYLWRYGEPPTGRPVLTVMPLNGLVSATRTPSGSVLRARRLRRFRSEVSCTAADDTFADLGDGIRHSPAADIAIDGQRVRGALEFRH
jgi:hypothetical protein